MNDPERIINVGLYGHTRAGKTRFLYELLSKWETSRRAVDGSKECLHFLKKVGAQLQRNNQPAPTTEAICGIRVAVKGGDAEKAAITEYVFRDLRGEALARELDSHQSLETGKWISPQVRECDAFLFFLDPAPRELLTGDGPEAMDRHHEEELRRLRRFLEFVLRTRQNDYLPVVVVQTHLDEWEQDPVVANKAQAWLAKARDEVRRAYDRYAKRHYPEPLTEYGRICCAISSVRSLEEIEKPIRCVHSLLTEKDAFRSQDQQRIRPFLWFALGASLLLALVVLALVLNAAFGVMGGYRLKRLQQAIATNREVTGMPTDDVAAELNEALKEVLRSPGSHTDDESRALCKEAVRVIRDKLRGPYGGTTEQAVQIAEAYLQGLPDQKEYLPELAEAQNAFWRLYRQFVVDELREVVKRRTALGSSPADTLDEIVERLKQLRQEMENVDVYGGSTEGELAEELAEAQAFLQDRRTQGGHTARFYARGKLPPIAAASRHFFLLRLVSPQQAPNSFELRRKDRKGAVESKKGHVVHIGLGEPVACELFVYDGHNWKQLHTFTITERAARKSLTLAALGMPLIQPGGENLEKVLAWEGYELEVFFEDLPQPPALLWKVVTP